MENMEHTHVVKEVTRRHMGKENVKVKRND